MCKKNDQFEIGGYFEMERNHGPEYHTGAVALNTGRNCLRYLIRVNQIKSIWLPRWNCDAIRQVCDEEGVKVCYYSISEETLEPILGFDFNCGEWLYFVNYFGLFDDTYINKIKTKYITVIVDNAQAFYRMPCEGVETLYTCRKFFGVTDGAYLYTAKRLKEEIPYDKSYKRFEYLLGRLETNAKEHYLAYRDNEDELSKLPLAKMSLTTRNILKGIDYDSIKKKRTYNFSILREELDNLNTLSLTTVEGAFAYPLLVRNGSVVRNRLIENDIFIPTLWPNVLEDLSKADCEYDITKNLVVLPCDQRYTPCDLEKMITITKELVCS